MHPYLLAEYTLPCSFFRIHFIASVSWHLRLAYTRVSLPGTAPTARQYTLVTNDLDKHALLIIQGFNKPIAQACSPDTARQEFMRGVNGLLYLTWKRLRFILRSSSRQECRISGMESGRPKFLALEISSCRGKSVSILISDEESNQQSLTAQRPQWKVLKKCGNG